MSLLSGIGTWLRLNKLRIHAKLGTPEAQYDLGILYSQGDGVPQDYSEALKWFRKAGEQGFSPAYIVLGEMYGRGEGMVPDQAEALRWYAEGP